MYLFKDDPVGIYVIKCAGSDKYHTTIRELLEHQQGTGHDGDRSEGAGNAESVRE